MGFWIIGAVFVIYCIVMVPMQYRNIDETKKELKKSGLTHNEAYENMSFEVQQLQYNLQGNLLNFPATLIAQLLYFVRHRGQT